VPGTGASSMYPGTVQIMSRLEDARCPVPVLYRFLLYVECTVRSSTVPGTGMSSVCCLCLEVPYLRCCVAVAGSIPVPLRNGTKVQCGMLSFVDVACRM
jgi:hypothetical protein